MNTQEARLIRRLTEAELNPPKSATLAVTNRCNLSCVHCWPKSGPEESATEVPLKRVLRLIDEFEALGAEKIAITGGEPLTHPAWFEMIDHAINLPGIHEVVFQTNAIMITPKHVDSFLSLKNRGLIIQTSLEGAAPSTHDRVRGEGSFARTLQGIRLLEKSGLAPNVCIAFTEMRHNFEDIPELLKLVEKMGIKQFVSGALVAVGRASESSGLALPTATQYRNLLARFQNDKDFRDRYRRIGNVAALEWSVASGADSAAESCCSFIENPYVTANGNLYPCVMLHSENFAAKRAYERPLAASVSEMAGIWSRLQRIKKLRLTQIPDCKNCSHYSVCGGGCFGRAYSVHRDFFAKEDRCRLRQAIYEGRLKK